MLTLIIVDDEKLLTDSLQSDMDWESLGFGSVYKAYNSRQAKEVFERERIDLMLCDIEMPQGSGLELLAWVREKYPHTETVFMTCHAQFKLAQRAMQLGSFDYLLKPIPNEELHSVVSKVAEKISKDNEDKQYSRIGQFWSRHQPLLAERLWIDILNHTIPSNLDMIKREALERGIPFDEKLQFLPVLIIVKRYHKAFTPRDEKVLEYALKNSGNEMLGIDGNGLLFAIAERELLALIPIEHDAAVLREELRERAKPFITSSADYFYCDIAIYIGSEVYGHELNGMVQRLLEWDKSNIALATEVFMYGSKRQSQGTISLPDIHLWSVMLKERRGDQVMNEAEAFLRGNIDLLDEEMLHMFHHNFLQMIFYVLKLDGIDAHLLFNNETSAALFRQALRSVPDMMNWTKHIVSRSMEYIENSQQSQSIMHKIEQFISGRLDAENLSREDVAAHMFLNPDYLDRLLKKEVGCSITEFIVNKRMRLAQDLLLKTNLPVGTIAAQSGYVNLAHFSRRFKRYAGTSPHEFRKANVASEKR
ncbi:response regulator [Paenibacillus sinopodophylli]|uniref:response regulator n=1 Tax=Paenibacillus sinopodophylli TaxID=1837342 RepID=UPI00110CC036|nr:response regulator [Paenibacillus sinopodophylli]